MATHARRVLGDSMLFRGLAAEEKKALFARVHVHKYPAGTMIFPRGSPGDSIMAVLAGSVRISVPTTDGRPLVLALMSAGDVFGEIAVLDGRERTTDALAVAECSLATLARSDILSFLHAHPAAWTNIVGILCERLRKLNDHVADLGLPQLFLVLEPAEIERVRRFAEHRRYAPGEALFRIGESGHGLFVVLSGKVDLVRQDELGNSKSFLSFGAGGVIGEMAQLSGRPALVDAYAEGPVEVLSIPPDRLRALLIAEAELGERIMDALILRRVGMIEKGTGGPVIVGRAESGDVLRLKGFLTRNGHPYEWLNAETDAKAKVLIERYSIDPGDFPIVLCPGGELLRNPSEGELARSIGLVGPIDPDRLFDVAVVGAGPAGLATTVYGGSEGLSVIMLDCRSFGGQAGASARIENYLGFPTGITGMALMARAFGQAHKFGVETAIPVEVTALESAQNEGAHHVLRLGDGQHIQARSVVIASGARYRRLAVENLDHFEAASVHYWASPLEANLCAGQEIVLVGGGNSAGQAVVFLARKAAKIWHLVRGASLAASMSSYLVERISGLANVEVLTGTEVSGLEGNNGLLEAVRWRRIGSDEEMRRPVRHLFLFIGADPNTNWLAGSGVLLDPGGFVIAGPEVGADRRPLETSRLGVFAIGDVRSGSVKRVAAAVGEGAQVVAALHAFLAARTDPDDGIPPTAGPQAGSGDVQPSL
ncbi:MAG: cyclic nucleotide-binding domain-containing protein [Xanthobacteraceae bacterium]|nr:cyclic nucleotide-binding domain-containing protein [Xanthobacteraceae bacterium]